MAILKQSNDAQLVYTGWHGLCKDDNSLCENFPLFTGTGNTSEYIYDNIKYIYEISDNSQAEVVYNGTITGNELMNKIQRGAVQSQFGELECGKCYRIVLKTGDGQVDIPDFMYANRSDDDVEQDVNNRITNDCNAGGGSIDYAFTTISGISDTLDEGYTNGDVTIFDAEAHDSIITSAVGVQRVSIQANTTGLQYKFNGPAWADVTTSAVTIISNFTDLEFRVKEGLNAGSHDIVVTLTATPDNAQFVSLDKTLNFNVTINPVSISASKTITEELEEGTPGTIHSFDITFENLDGIGITTDSTLHTISASQNGNFGNGISIPNPSSSPVTIYVKLDGNMPSSDVTTKFTVIGDRRSSGPLIRLTDAITVTSTVAPRPQITALSVNPTYTSGHLNTIPVSVAFSDKNNYGGHHWHYKVESGSDVWVLVQMPAFGDSVTLNKDDFSDAGDYVLTAWVVRVTEAGTGDTLITSHDPIAGSDEKTANFTIAADNATLSVNPSSVNEILDVDENQTTHTINFSSNNLTNVTYTQSLNNWEFPNTLGGSSSGSTSFAIKLKDSVKNTDVSSGPVDLPQETITITGDVGVRDTSGDSVKSVQVTLDAKLMDNSEFTITGANLNVTDNRDFGESSSEFGPYTVTFDAVTLSTYEMTNWEVEFNDDGTWTAAPDFGSIASGTTFKVRLQEYVTLPGTYNETFTIATTASASDHDSSNDPSAITMNLNSTISALSANLGNPGTQTLDPITHGETPSNKTFVISGTRIENISISNVSPGWSVTPTNPSIGSTVTISYPSDASSVGTKTGTFKISADPITGSTLSTTEYTVNMTLVVNPKLAEIDTSPSSITLDSVLALDESDTKSVIVASVNVDNIVVTTIPSGFVVRSGSSVLSNGDSIGDGATLTISLLNTNTLGTKSGNLVLTGTESANSDFPGSSNKNIALSGTVVGLTTQLAMSPMSITDTYDQDETPDNMTILNITYTNLSQITISGGSANKYRVARSLNSAEGFKDSLTIDVVDYNEQNSIDVIILLQSTATPGTISSTFTISGVKSSIGASNPSNATLSCTATVNEVDTGGGGDCCEGYTKIETGTAGHSNVSFSSAAGTKLCFKPIAGYTEIVAAPWQIPVILGTGAPVGVIVINQRNGGISTSTFETTTFIFEDADGNFWEADLNGKDSASGVPVTFSSLTCGGSTEPVDCCDNQTEIDTGTAGHSNVSFSSAAGTKLCFKPIAGYTEIVAAPWQIPVILGTGAPVGVIVINQRNGGISTSTFETTIFTFKDAQGNCWTADLDGKDSASGVPVVFQSA
jgi:hypothetical protein